VFFYQDVSTDIKTAMVTALENEEVDDPPRLIQLAV